MLFDCTLELSRIMKTSSSRHSIVPPPSSLKRRGVIVESNFDNLLATALDSEMFSDRALRQVPIV